MSILGLFTMGILVMFAAHVWAGGQLARWWRYRRRRAGRRSDR
mgnify:CR=1 FL=1